jgi:hypothetical protein
VLKFTQIELKNLLAALKAAAAPLDALLVGLVAAPFTPGTGLVFGDLTLATFDGYAPSAAVVWSPAHNGTGGSAEIIGDTKSFVCSGATTPNVVYGYLLYTGTTLVACDTFDTPVPIQGSGDYVSVTPRVNLRNQAG